MSPPPAHLHSYLPGKFSKVHHMPPQAACRHPAFTLLCLPTFHPYTAPDFALCP